MLKGLRQSISLYDTNELLTSLLIIYSPYRINMMPK